MADAVSAVGGAEFRGAVTVREVGPTGMITLRGDLGSDAVAKAVKAATGLGAVPGEREIGLDGDKGAAWMSPDELLILVPYAEAEKAVTAMEKAPGKAHALVVNVSDARAHFRISGAGVREVLAKGAPVDLSPDAFGAGTIRRSRVGQVAAAFWLSDTDCFDLVCFRSVGEYMFTWLSTAGAKDSLPGYLS
ncbi:sarcosine oxidase subunit gamma [Maritimibacter sp. 55A14]|uniref:sarcosine oxidase subunit gamma n=1 Tax=Maritimibacter sp. 55A14 TaxID=2174844 RepID=UPI000D615E90|nr:sarcosine oxidase subunit gamma family protein [Maritimibacter sp. 55A14]PWE33993.1 sarcosine oxidase subunit gamma [Maritimibacter sp. 55A14]